MGSLEAGSIVSCTLSAPEKSGLKLIDFHRITLKWVLKSMDQKCMDMSTVILSLHREGREIHSGFRPVFLVRLS